MGIEFWFQLVKDGGGYCAVLELGAIIWLLGDRKELKADLKAERAQGWQLAEQLLTVTAELKTFLFSERKV